MNRREFMRQLNLLLNDIPNEERQEALRFYESYFEDAGEENEAKIMEELESPRKVAESIKAELHAEASDTVEDEQQASQDASGQQSWGEQVNYGSQTQGGTEHASANGNAHTQYKEFQRQRRQEGYYTNQTNNGYYGAQGQQAGSTYTLGQLFTSPVQIPLFILNVIVDIAVIILAIISIITAIGFAGSGIGMIGLGIAWGIAAGAGGALFLSGIGIILIGLLVIMIMVTIMICGRLVPYAFEGMKAWRIELFKKERGEQL